MHSNRLILQAARKKALCLDAVLVPVFYRTDELAERPRQATVTD